MTKQAVGHMTDNEYARYFGRKVNRAAQARAAQAQARRAELIRKLGWQPEDGTAAGRYVATEWELEEILAGR